MGTGEQPAAARDGRPDPAESVAPIAFDIVGEGLQFPEAPVVCADGSFIVGEQRSGHVTRIGADGRLHRIADCGGAPNGLAFGPDGALYGCNNGGFAWIPVPGTGRTIPIGNPPGYTSGWIERIDPATGKVDRLYDSCDGIPLAAPNDIVFDADGDFWFTDLGRDMGDHARHGGLYHARCDGSSIRRIAHALGLNGVGLSPDGATVYAAETLTRLIFAFPARYDAAAASPSSIPSVYGRGMFAARVVASFPGRELLDSMAIEADGTIAQAIVSEGCGIARVDVATGRTDTLALPDRFPTNVCFGGSDMRDAFVTLSESGRLARIRWPAPGLKLAFAGQ